MPDAVPNYLTIDANGSIGADFSGHIHAAGLDLDAATTTTPPDTDRIRWLRASDGTLAADLSAYKVISGSAEFSQISTSAILGTNAGGNRQEAAVRNLVQGGIGGAAPVTAQVSVDCTDDTREHSAIVLSSLAQSDFLQVAHGVAQSSQRVVLHIGGVASNGTIATAGTKDWTSTRNAVGDYSISYAGGLSAGLGNLGHILNFAVIKGSGFILIPEVVAAPAGSFNVQFFDPGGVLRDTAFHFYAITID